MKPIKYFYIILFLSFFNQVANAQKPELVPTKKEPKKFLEYYIGDYKFKERNNWVLFGFGPTFYPVIKNINNANFCVDYHFFDKKDRLWFTGYRAITQEYLALGGGTIYLHDFKFGRSVYRIEKQYWKVAGFIGPSFNYAAYYPLDTARSIKGDKTFGVGIQAQAEIILKPVYDFGISVTPFINYNTIQPVAGLTISVYGSNAMIRKNIQSKQR